MNKKQKEKTTTPIIDGDARPDMPLNIEDKKGRKRPKDEKKFTAERGSDMNSLEDFKDAKEP